jgi:hypothetical protein
MVCRERLGPSLVCVELGVHGYRGGGHSRHGAAQLTWFPEPLPTQPEPLPKQPAPVAPVAARDAPTARRTAVRNR